MDEHITIPSQLKPDIDQFYDDLSAVLTEYELEVITDKELYAFMVNLHKQISLITYTD